MRTRCCFAKKYREALPLLQAAYGETNPSADWQVRTLLAWAYVETRRNRQGGRLGESVSTCLCRPASRIFASLIFPRYLFVRSAVLSTREAGRSQEEPRRPDRIGATK